ncbi:uncharacterized protein [Triticum aestivum]|nr:uncharacterized protein LOC123134406 isoform X2 [Triticum aestivum]
MFLASPPGRLRCTGRRRRPIRIGSWAFTRTWVGEERWCPQQRPQGGKRRQKSASPLPVSLRQPRFSPDTDLLHQNTPEVDPARSKPNRGLGRDAWKGEGPPPRTGASTDRDRCTCTQYACATVALLCAKLEFTRYEHAPEYTAPLDMNKFVRYFRRCYYHEDATGSAIPLTLNYICEFGIPIRNVAGSHLPPVGPEFNLRIGGYFHVDPTDTDFITRLIASGFPLVGLIEAGRRFNHIRGREVYVTPQEGTEPGMCHTVAIIGSGLELRNVSRPDNRLTQPVYETYFVIRDSYGPYAHGSSARSFAHDGVSVGYDFNVWASDLREAWGVWNPQG